MSRSQRVATDYPGVFYRIAERIGKSGEEKVFYIVFKKDGKVIEEKVGRQYADGMTPFKAAGIRGERIEGKRLSRKEMRLAKEEAKRVQAQRADIARLWGLYQDSLPDRNWNTDRILYRLYLEEKFAKRLPSELTTLEIDTLRQEILKAKKSPQTVKHILALLRRIIRFGAKKGLSPMPDPSKLYFAMPVVDNEVTECLNQEQLRKYLEALDKEEDQNAAALLRLALATGMRKGALLALRWNDIDLAAGFITLRGIAAKKGKTERIPLSAAAREILSRIDQYDSPYVFPGRDGQQRKEFSRIARRVRDAAGLPQDFRPLHGLRHTYASFLASSGQVDLYTLQKLLTHSSPLMSQRYAHLADAALQRAASVANSIFTAKQEEEDDI